MADDVVMASKEFIEIFSGNTRQSVVEASQNNQITEKIVIGSETFVVEILAIKIDDFSIDSTIKSNKGLYSKIFPSLLGKNIKFSTLLPEFSKNCVTSIELDHELKLRIIAARLDS